MKVEDYETFLKHVYRTAPIGLCLFDTELRYRHINEWLASINGLSVEAHLGRTISEVIPDVSAGVESLLRRVMETGEPVLDGVLFQNSAECLCRFSIVMIEEPAEPLSTGDPT